MGDTSDMVSTSSTAPESGASSPKTEESASLLEEKDSYRASVKKQVEELLLLNDEENPSETIRIASLDAPSDEEGGLEKSKLARLKWQKREDMLKTSSFPGESPASTDGQNRAPIRSKWSGFDESKLKWDTKTASMTKKRVDDMLSPRSWHGRRSSQDLRKAPVKTNSIPRKSKEKTKPGALAIPDVFQKQNNGDDRSLSPKEPRGNIAIPSAFRPTEDDESIGVPLSPSNKVKSKIPSMSESENFESSTTSFITELPQIPNRRRRFDGGGNSVASSVIRGGQIFKILGPIVHRPISSFVPNNQPASQGSNSEPTSSHTRVSATSADSTDGDITEYASVFPSRHERRRSGVPRSGSMSSQNFSIGTYDDEAGALRQEEMQLETIPSGGSGEQDYEIVPLKDAPPSKRDTDFEEYEEELRVVEDSGENDFVVDRVPTKKRWSSKNIHNFPVWPPIIKVQTWQKKNVSAVSVGSGFTLDDSFCDSNAAMSSLGDDDLSYDESEFVRRPPEHRTSYRIRYDGPTSLKLNDIYKRPIGMDSSERFEPSGKPSDGLPSMPARRVVDAAPSAPPRSSSTFSDDERSVTLSQAGEEPADATRPDVWITPSATSLSAEAMWKVKRVWAIETEDEKEQEHDVHGQDLFDKIKHLVGASKHITDDTTASEGNSAEDCAPQLPKRSWHVQAVYEKKGHVENVAAEKSLDERELEMDMEVMAQEAVKEIEKNQKIFEEYKKKSEERKADEISWAADEARDMDPDAVEAPEEKLFETEEEIKQEFSEASEERRPEAEEGTQQESSEVNIDSVEQSPTELPLSALDFQPIYEIRKEYDSTVCSDSDDDSFERANEDGASPKRRGKKSKKKTTTKSSVSPKPSRKGRKSHVSPTSSKRSSSSTPIKSSKPKAAVDGQVGSQGLLPPKSPRKSSQNGTSPMTPRGGKKSKIKLTSSKSPNDEPKKTSKKNSIDGSKHGKETKEKTTPRRSKKKVVAISQMVHQSEYDSPSSDDTNDKDSSSSKYSSATSDEHYEALASTGHTQRSSARLALSAMVHDSSESDFEDFDSDDRSFAEDTGIAPRVVQPAGSPRPGWWNTPNKKRTGRRALHTVEGLPPPLTGSTRRSSKTG